MTKEEMIIADFVESIQYFDLENKYLRLYEFEDDNFKKIFAYFHQRFNNLFDFLNQKNGVNKHYNAHESRELDALIEQFEELSFALKGVGKEILLNNTYITAIEYCKGFLVMSGGSTIPDDFVPIKLIKYEPILEVPNKNVNIPHLKQNYRLSMVGQGAFSIVQKYKDEYYNSHFAVKQAKKGLDKRELERFRKEFEILKNLSFPYVLEVYSYDETKDSYTMEYCQLTLDDYITKNPNLTFKYRKTIALQFLYGINYLHSKKILHRDISYRNILIKRYEYNSAIVKLSDFGLMKSEESKFTKSDTEIKGTIIDPCLEKFKDYNVQNEIYAIGVVLLFIFTGRKNLKPGKEGVYPILNKCIDNDISGRYSKVSEIITDLDKLQPEDNKE